MGSCSNLTRLHWGGTVSLEQLAPVIEKPIWAHLEDFSLDYFRGSDKEFAAYISTHLPPLKHLKLSVVNFGSECFAFLRERRLDSLRTLSLTGIRAITSRMALDILLQFPYLTLFGTERIDLRDFRSTPQPWVCQELKHFQVFLKSDPDNPGADTLLLDQLSKLVHVEDLDVRHYSAQIPALA